MLFCTASMLDIFHSACSMHGALEAYARVHISALEFTIKFFIHNRYQNINFVVFHHMHPLHAHIARETHTHSREWRERARAPRSTWPHGYARECTSKNHIDVHIYVAHGVRVRAMSVLSSAYHAAYHARCTSASVLLSYNAIVIVISTSIRVATTSTLARTDRMESQNKADRHNTHTHSHRAHRRNETHTDTESIVLHYARNAFIL